jgi:hypothetical protein
MWGVHDNENTECVPLREDETGIIMLGAVLLKVGTVSYATGGFVFSTSRVASLPILLPLEGLPGHSFCSLYHDRSTVSAKATSRQTAI